MNDLMEWKYLKKLRENERGGVLTVVLIIAGVLMLAAAVFAIVKLCINRDECDCGCCEEDCEDYVDKETAQAANCDENQNRDENGCGYASEKDFV